MLLHVSSSDRGVRGAWGENHTSRVIEVTHIRAFCPAADEKIYYLKITMYLTIAIVLFTTVIIGLSMLNVQR